MKDNLLLEEISYAILGIDPIFEDYEFIHSVMFTPERPIPSPDDSLKFLKNIYKKMERSDLFSDKISLERKSFIQNILTSVMTQVDCFVENKNREADPKEIVPLLISADLPDPFPLFPVQADEDEMVSFKSESDLLSFIEKEYETLKKHFTPIVLSLFGYNLEKVLRPITFRVSSSEELPHSYAYHDGVGVASIKFEKSLSLAHLLIFIYHEILPGHHFYYSIRQEQLENHLMGIDIFYSPDIVINEGLAVNYPLLLPDRIAKDILLKHEKEQMIFKAFYNIWHAYYISKKNFDTEKHFIIKEMGIPLQIYQSHFENLIIDLKYYTPAYPIGGHAVKKFSSKFGIDSLSHLYTPHSLKTLPFLEERLSKRQ